MKKLAIFAAAVAVGTATLSAQNYLGQLPYVSDFWMSRMHGLSGQSAGLGTTRSAAMGGAFTSLGADLSSMNINPAGLGMYRNSEFGITLGPTIAEMTSSMKGQPTAKESYTGFALNNFGAAFNLFEGAGTVTSFTLGVGYNRLADYNYRSRITIPETSSSYLDMLEVQLEGYYNRIGPDGWKAGGSFGTGSNAANLYEWGSVLGWETGMLNKGASEGDFIANHVLSGGALVNKSLRTISKGSQGEYTFSGGWNLNNKFYFGFTLGVVDLYQDREVTYTEDYTNNAAPDPLLGMTYSQRVRTSGEGYNGKFGFIYRPDPSLRIGVAFHTPTVMTVRDKYNSTMTAHFGNGNNWHSTPEVEFQNRFYTPSRLLAGVSYTLANRAIIAVDYERAFYNGMGVWGDDYGRTVKDNYRNAVKRYFEGGNTLRIGAEVQATDALFLRAGYTYSRDGVRAVANDPAAIEAGKIEPLDTPTLYESNILSAGFGVKIGARTSFDMTYSFGDYKYTDYDIYFYNANNQTHLPVAGSPDMTRQKLSRHNIMLGLNFRF